MFEQRGSGTHLHSGVRLAELVYHETVRKVRNTHSNAFMALAVNIFQALLLVAAFYVFCSRCSGCAAPRSAAISCFT